MKRREKILLGGFLAVIVVWQGLASDFITGPITRRQNDLRLAQEAVSKKEDRQLEIAKARADLRKWEQQSLPPDANIAASQYQHWLIDLAGKHQLTGVRVEPHRIDAKPAKDNPYRAVQMTIKAQARLD